MSKIIFNIVQSNVKGGLESVFLDYSDIINSNKDYKIICLTSKNFPHNKEIENNNIKRINLDIKGHFDIFASIKLYFLIKKHQPSLIIGHNGRVFAALNIIKKLFRIKNKTLAISHGGNVKRLLNFDYAIGVASHITQNIKEKDSKIITKTIYNGIKIEDFKQKTTKKDNLFTFGMMSRLSSEKNIDLAITAFTNFYQNINSSSQLIIAGEGEEKERLLKLCHKFNIENQVQFIGWTSNKEDFFNKIDVFLQTSIKESFGLSVLESFNYFTPVISSNAKGPKEIITNNKTGFLFDSENQNSLLEKMKYIYKNFNKGQNIAQNAHKDLLNKFSYEIMSKNLLNFIKNIRI
ncbi:glycosyltransferase [Rickettsiales bacterium]|nr:glycosyltransferase [Rickettsiales bacterium]